MAIIVTWVSINLQLPIFIIKWIFALFIFFLYETVSTVVDGVGSIVSQSNIFCNHLVLRTCVAITSHLNFKHNYQISLPERGREYIKYFIPTSGKRTHNRRVYNHTLAPLHHEGLSNNFLYKYDYIYNFDVFF